jgi:hypothetical protein
MSDKLILSPSDKVIAAKVSNKSPPFHETQEPITMFVTDHHLSSSRERYTSFCSAHEFLCVKMICNTFYKMFIVFYIVKIRYILCTYDLLHMLLSLWHAYGSMECKRTYVRTSVRTYVCMYVCMYVLRMYDVCVYVCIYMCLFVCLLVWFFVCVSCEPVDLLLMELDTSILLPFMSLPSYACSVYANFSRKSDANAI